VTSGRLPRRPRLLLTEHHKCVTSTALSAFTRFIALRQARHGAASHITRVIAIAAARVVIGDIVQQEVARRCFDDES